MAPDRDQLVAEAMGTAPELVPLLPALFSGFQALGGWPNQVVTLLAAAPDRPAVATVVDLGCGKGAASVAIARKLGWRVTGVDLFAPFLDEAVAAAAAAGVGRLCSFELADLREVVRRAETFDVAVFAAVGAGLFGDYAGCAGALRQCVRPGGWIVVCDGVLKPAAAVPASLPGYGYYRPHPEAVRQLTAHGDLLVRELLIPADELERQSRKELRVLRRNVQRLLGSQPELQVPLDGFLASQEAEYAFILQATLEAVWLLRRA